MTEDEALTLPIADWLKWRADRCQDAANVFTDPKNPAAMAWATKAAKYREAHSVMVVPIDETETKYFRKGVVAFLYGEPYAILTSDSEWRRGWTAGFHATNKQES